MHVLLSLSDQSSLCLMAVVQRHNEEKLNAAFKADSTVLLVFSVNMSGHFQGYAKMTTLVTRGRVSPCSFCPCYSLHLDGSYWIAVQHPSA